MSRSSGDTPSPLYPTAQWIILAWTPRVSAALSILGSAAIIMIIIRGGKEKLSRLHNRLFLGMSAIDILNSAALGASTAAFPRELNDIFYGAIGNKATCAVQGFFAALGGAVPLYNSSLCIYYWLIIKHNVRDDVLLKYERYFHGFPLLPSLFVATFAASFNMLHPRSKGICMFADGCEFEDPDTCEPRPVALTTFLKIYSWIFCSLIIITITYCMGSIYFYVREQAIAMKKYQSFQRGNSINGGNNQKTSTHRETMIQAILYVSAFFSSFVWVIVLSFMKSDRAAPFAIMFLKSTFHPMQGFWNFFIFCRPKYIDLREKKKSYSFFQIMKMVVYPTDKDEKPESKRNVNDKTKQHTSNRRLEMIKRSSMVLVNHDNAKDESPKHDGPRPIKKEDEDEECQDSTNNNAHVKKDTESTLI